MGPEFGALTQRLAKVETNLGPAELTRAMGVVGLLAKGDFIEAIVPAIGPDRKFSGWKRLGVLDSKMKLGDQEFTIAPTPYGGWIVADKGRRPGSVAPSRSAAPDPSILKTPWGPRTYYKATPLRIGPTRGKNSLTIAKALVRARSGKRMEEQIQKRLQEVYGTGLG